MGQSGEADIVSSVTTLACHIGGPICVNPGELALVYGTSYFQSNPPKGLMNNIPKIAVPVMFISIMRECMAYRRYKPPSAKCMLSYEQANQLNRGGIKVGGQELNRSGLPEGGRNALLQSKIPNVEGAAATLDRPRYPLNLIKRQSLMVWENPFYGSA